MSEQLSRLLVQRALAGDHAAVRRLIDALTPVVQARVARVLLRRAGAARGRDVRQEVEDLAQEVFVSLFENDARALRSWEPEKGMSLRNFVGLVAERQSISILRSGRRSPWTEDPTLNDELTRSAGRVEGTAETRTASRQQLALVLDRMRAELSPKGFRLFQLIVMEQRTVKVVQAETGMSADAVYAWRSRLAKFARKIRAEILSEGEGAARTPGRRLKGAAT